MRGCVRLSVVLAAATLTLAGCGGDDDEAEPAGESGAGASTGESADISGTTMTFVSWGGTYQDAQEQTMTTPFAEARGVEFLQDGPTDYAKIKTQVEAGQVTWDVIDMDPYFAIQQCNKLLVPIDTSVVDTSKMPPELVSECAVPSMVYSTANYYNADKFGDGPPTDWADFFDTEKFPGKRAVFNDSQGGALEAALMADGVAEEDLYPIDYDRAFAKLDTIKDDLIFWDEGAQAQQMIETGEADMVMAWLGRGYTAIKNGANYEPVWNGAQGVYDVFTVPKGSKNEAAAMEFISYATGAEAQTGLAEALPYAPINSDADPQVDELLASFLPTKPEISEQMVTIDQDWWAANKDEADQLWTSWTGG